MTGHTAANPTAYELLRNPRFNERTAVSGGGRRAYGLDGL